MDFEFLAEGFDPIICLCESEKLREAIALSEKISRGKNVVQLFDANKDIIERIVPAYINAALRSYDGSMRTKSIRSEMMIFVSGKLDIARAVESCGAKGSRFVAFSNSNDVFNSFTKNGSIKVLKKYKPPFSLDVAKDVASTELRSE